MLSWGKLKLYHRQPQDGILKRSRQMEEAYIKYKNELEERGIKIHEHLHNLYFKDCDFFLQKNRFPYDLEEGISHYLFWIKPPFSPSDAFLDKIIRDSFPNQDIIYFENSYQNRSVKNIKHLHIFVKEK